jgi:hypothetical protein
MELVVVINSPTKTRKTHTGQNRLRVGLDTKPLSALRARLGNRLVRLLTALKKLSERKRGQLSINSYCKRVQPLKNWQQASEVKRILEN